LAIGARDDGRIQPGHRTHLFRGTKGECDEIPD
jgi:hypothetical protein